MPTDKPTAPDIPIATQVGDALIVGFDGLEPTANVLERIRAGRAGGIILFARNVHAPDQVRDLCVRLQEARAAEHDSPLLIAIDQEGGTVARLRDPWPELPGNMALGAADDEALAYDTGRCLAAMLRDVGITLNCAPVLDLASTPDNPGIGVRSFGANPDRVAALGCATIRGIQEGGVAATAKHFPGMGDARQDAHDDLPIVQTSLRDLQLHHMPPFIAAMEAGVAAIMTAHCAYPHLERMTRLPATVNRRLFQHIVRREIGYDGAIISDCMEMKAFTKWLSPEAGATNAIMAGVDLLLVCHTPAVQDAVYDALVDAIGRGLIADQILQDAATRSAALRRFGAHAPSPPPDAHAVAATVAARAVTLLRGGDWAPITGGRVTLLVPEAFLQTAVETDTLGRLDPLVAALEQGGCTVAVCPLHSEVALPPAEAVLLATANAHLRPPQATAARDLVQRADCPVLVAALRNPFDADLFPDYPVALTYSDTPAAQEALAAVLLGQAEATGRAPVPLQSAT